jgi:glycosyltransferase involved in cell wall biosynthesis
MDPQFGRTFRWDLDLLAGYTHRFPRNAASELGGFWDTGLPSEYRKLLGGGRFTALLLPGWHTRACWEALVLASRRGLPVWIRGDSNDLKIDPPRTRIVKRPLLSAFFRGVDRFLCVGAATRRLYESYGIEGNRLAWAPHAVDNARFAAAASEYRSRRQSLRRLWRIPEDAFCLLFAVKFIPEKRPLDLIAALRALATLDPTRRYHTLFVGSGELGAPLRSGSHVVFDSESPESLSVSHGSERK